MVCKLNIRYELLGKIKKRTLRSMLRAERTQVRKRGEPPLSIDTKHFEAGHTEYNLNQL